MKRDDVYFEAMKSRDHRFDGKFFVGVKTTNIYCRPICPAKPKRENVEFFLSMIEAEKAGYRPCLRCRPESAPQSPAWIGKTAVVQRAVKVLNSMNTLHFNEDRFADQFGVTARHLRRLFQDEIGKTPKQLSFELRLNLSRQLLVETNLSIAESAFASGFQSVRRFNDAFKDRFKRSPREIRKKKKTQTQGVCISLPYRPPFDFEGLMQTYENHRMGNLEWFEKKKMHRIVSHKGKVGKVIIANNPDRSCLDIEIDFPDVSAIHVIVSKVRNLFDLDSDPIAIANALETDPEMKKLLKVYPGIRLFSGWDPFEVSIATILGQLVSVDFGRKLVHDLIEIAGSDSGIEVNGKKINLFPTPEQIINADLTNLKTTGIRKQTLKNFAQAILDKTLSLEPTQDVDEFIKKALQIKGIGPWSAQSIALRALRSADTFPGSDLILARALQIHPQEVLDRMAPWRGYVAALLWRAYAQTLKKTNQKKGK